MKLSEEIYRLQAHLDKTMRRAQLWVVGDLQELGVKATQLEAENAALKRVTTGMDVHGLKAIATELAKSKPPYSFPSLWRDTGFRQRQIGEQLLCLVDALLKEPE